MEMPALIALPGEMEISAGLESPSEMLRGKTDSHASFSDRRGDHLRRSRANIAHGEDARLTALNKEWAATKFVPRVPSAQARRQLWTGENEPFGVESKQPRKPLGAWFGTDQNN